MSLAVNIAMAAFLVLPLLAIVFLNLLKKETGSKIALQTGMVVSVAQIFFAVVTLIALWQIPENSLQFSIFWNMSADSAYFTVDVFSLIVLICIGMVTLVSCCTGVRTLRGKDLNFTNIMMVLILGMNGIVMVNDLFSFYVFLEITAIASFILIALYRDKKGLEGSFKYLIMSTVATIFLLLAMALMFMYTESLSYEAIFAIFADWSTGAHPFYLVLALILFITGISIKAGLVPFHNWLPDAYQAAPSAVSVVLGGIVTKVVGVYAIIRLMHGTFSEVFSMNYVLMMVGILSVVLGAIVAYKQSDFKRILAYSSISQIGYIILGVACGNVFGFIGAVLHFFNHATFKTTLFVNAAAVEKETGLSDVDRLGGLSKQMPITGISSILAFLSAAGLPPLAGFWSKLFIIIALWQAGFELMAFIAIFTSVFTLAYFLRLQRKVFFGPEVVYNAIWPMNYTKTVKNPDYQPIEVQIDINEPRNAMIFSQIFLSVVTVAVGILIPFIISFLHLNGIF
ncbi:MAG: complex I subunit 5 family protein [Bacillota bacterium]